MPGALAALGALATGYLLGSLPVGLIAGRLTRGVDLREEGSGRTGATNALRTLGPRAAAVVLVLDVAKGALAVWIGSDRRHQRAAFPRAGGGCRRTGARCR